MKLASIRAIAICQILGGVLILIANLLALAQQGFPDSLLYLLTSMGLASLAVVAGFTLWQQSLIGVRLSIITQILQLTWISLPRSQFGAILGPLAGFQLSGNSSGDLLCTFSFGVYGRGGLFLLPADSSAQLPVIISFNLLALLALARLWPLLRSQFADPREKA